jgi:uncharacterized protein YebE (UPF0316 family)
MGECVGMIMMSIMDTSIFSLVIIPLLIFMSRIFDVSIGTIRIIFVSRGIKHIASVLGFFEVLIWLLAIGQIMKNLNNPINYIAYAGGFATGNYVGIWIENKLAMGISMIRIITRMEASILLTRLRAEGYVVTDVDAKGSSGMVKILFTVVKRKNISHVVDMIKKFNPQAFYTIESVNYVSKPAWPTIKHNKKLLDFFLLKKR